MVLARSMETKIWPLSAGFCPHCCLGEGRPSIRLPEARRLGSSPRVSGNSRAAAPAFAPRAHESVSKPVHAWAL